MFGGRSINVIVAAGCKLDAAAAMQLDYRTMRERSRAPLSHVNVTRQPRVDSVARYLSVAQLAHGLLSTAHDTSFTHRLSRVVVSCRLLA